MRRRRSVRPSTLDARPYRAGDADLAAEPVKSLLLRPLDHLRLRAPLRDGALLRLELALELLPLVQQVVDLVVGHAGLERLRQVDEPQQERHQDAGEHEASRAEGGAGACRDPRRAAARTGRAPAGKGGAHAARPGRRPSARPPGCRWCEEWPTARAPCAPAQVRSQWSQPDAARPRGGPWRSIGELDRRRGGARRFWRRP